MSPRCSRMVSCSLLAARARGEGHPVAELWNPRTGVVTVADQGIALARVGAAVQLLPDGTVLVTGGQGASGAAATDALRFLPEQSRFEAISLADASALVRA